MNHTCPLVSLLVVIFFVVGTVTSGCDTNDDDGGDNSGGHWQSAQSCTSDLDCPPNQSCIEGRCASGDTAQFKVYGTVVDWISGQPLGGAAVALAGNTDQTDSFGSYSLPTVSEGSYVLTVSKSGYFTVSTEISVFGSDKNYQVALPANMVLYEASADFFAVGESCGQTITAFDLVRVHMEGDPNCPYPHDYPCDDGAAGITLELPIKVLANNTVMAPSSAELHGDYACHWLGNVSQVDVKSEFLSTQESGAAVFLYMTGRATFNDSEACSECLPNGESIDFEIYTQVKM